MLFPLLSSLCHATFEPAVVALLQPAAFSPAVVALLQPAVVALLQPAAFSPLLSSSFAGKRKSLRESLRESTCGGENEGKTKKKRAKIVVINSYVNKKTQKFYELTRKNMRYEI